MPAMDGCSHLRAATVLESDADACPECVRMGSRWVHLRLCLECGHVGCCDSSPNRHARAHFEAEGHPTIRSIQPGERWGYCFEDDAFVERLGGRLTARCGP